MNQDQEIISRYIGQPARLPAELRARIEREWGNQPVQLYALADLDHGAQAQRVVGRVRPAARRGRASGVGWRLGRAVRRARRASVRFRSRPGLSANTLLLLGAPGRSAAARSCATRSGSAARSRTSASCSTRRSRAARSTSDDADRVYADAVARPVRDAQALVAGRRVGGHPPPARATSRRYRRELTLGLTAAAVMTLVSLVPPYLAGYLIDGVVRPAQEGTMARDAAATIAWIAVGGDGGAVRGPPGRGARAAAAHVGARRVGRARPARRAVRAHPAVEPVVLLAEEDGEPDHARHVGHRPAVGLRRVRRRGRVAVAGDAPRARRGAAHARLAARAGDDAAGAAVLLDDLPARRVARTRCSSARGGSGRA